MAINKLASAGMYFWDYGNAFLLEASRAGEFTGTDNNSHVTRMKTSLGANVCKTASRDVFAYPSYVQDIMG